MLVTLDLRGSDEGMGVDRDVLRAERDRALLDGLAELPPHDRILLGSTDVNVDGPPCGMGVRV